MADTNPGGPSNTPPLDEFLGIIAEYGRAPHVLARALDVYARRMGPRRGVSLAGPAGEALASVAPAALDRARRVAHRYVWEGRDAVPGTEVSACLQDLNVLAAAFAGPECKGMYANLLWEIRDAIRELSECL